MGDEVIKLEFEFIKIKMGLMILIKEGFLCQKNHRSYHIIIISQKQKSPSNLAALCSDSLLVTHKEQLLQCQFISIFLTSL